MSPSMFTPPHFSVTNAYISSRLAELTKCLKLTVYRLQHRGCSFALGKKHGCRGWISVVGTSPFSRDYFPVALLSSEGKPWRNGKATPLSPKGQGFAVETASLQSKGIVAYGRHFSPDRHKARSLGGEWKTDGVQIDPNGMEKLWEGKSSPL
ncbi:hypothetical protein ACFX15_035218 [Malus domestica]